MCKPSCLSSSSRTALISLQHALWFVRSLASWRGEAGLDKQETLRSQAKPLPAGNAVFWPRSRAWCASFERNAALFWWPGEVFPGSRECFCGSLFPRSSGCWRVAARRVLPGRPRQLGGCRAAVNCAGRVRNHQFYLVPLHHALLASHNFSTGPAVLLAALNAANFFLQLGHSPYYFVFFCAQLMQGHAHHRPIAPRHTAICAAAGVAARPCGGQ